MFIKIALTLFWDVIKGPILEVLGGDVNDLSLESLEIIKNNFKSGLGGAFVDPFDKGIEGWAGLILCILKHFESTELRAGWACTFDRCF